MKFKCIDVVQGVTKSGNSITKGAFRGVNKAGSPYLFIATCPPEFKPGTEYNSNVIFSQNGNYILPY